jgi:twinkle protein
VGDGVVIEKNLFDLLDEHGIPRLKSYQPGYTEKLICPKCGGGRTRDHCLSVTISDDGTNAMWQCHRGNCDGFSGKVFVKGGHFEPKPKPRPANPFADAEVPQDQPVYAPPWYWDFWANRHIGKKTLDDLGIHFSVHPVLADSIVFPYRWKGRLVNRKFRSHPNKDFRNDAGSQPTLFNVDSIDPKEPLYWVEGEIDVLTMHEMGYPHVVSLRDGAPQKVGQGDKRFEALNTHADALHKVGTHILCPDADKPGEAWLEELSRRLGRHRCKIVRWPAGRKDANDTLCMADDDERNTIEYCTSHAQRFPLQGIRDISERVIERAFTRKQPDVLTLGVQSIDSTLKFPAEGKLIVVSGVPSHGKSTFMRFVTVKTIQHYERKWLVFVQEDDFHDYVIDVAKIHADKMYSEVTREDRGEAGASFMNGGLRILMFDGERDPPTIDTILERARLSILQDGTTDLLLDPFNELEDAYEHGDQSQTQHIGRTLQRLKAFAKEYSCNVWVIAHPAKPSNGERHPPDGYSCAGSANWANKPDLGFSVWRPGPIGDVELYVWKSRTQRWGSAKTVAKAWFNASIGTYHTPTPKETEQAPTDTPGWID